MRLDDRGQLHRIDASHPECPTGGATLDRQSEAVSGAVQVGPATGSCLPRVGPRPAVGAPDDPQQIDFLRLPAAPDAGTDGAGHDVQPSHVPPGAQASGVSVSERMSIRQPVSRAASRAFCPSRPMASDSW
jgi:hypothetical protein